MDSVTDSTEIDIDGRITRYAEEGEGPVTLVLLSADTLEADGLAVIAHYLAEEAGFRVVRVAASDDSSDRVSEALAVLDHLGIADTWVGGHAAGGVVARGFAAAHTDRVNGLLLMGVDESDVPLAPGIPVLIIQGADDEAMPPVRGAELQASAPERASVKTLAGAGHDFPLTHPIDTAVIIEEYLDWD